MRKLIVLTLASLVFGFSTVAVEAATDKQKAAFKAEKKARKEALKVSKKADQANVKAAKAETKAALLVAKYVSVGGSASDIPDIDEILVERAEACDDDADELASWLLMTPEERAVAIAAHKAAEKAEKIAKKAALAAMTSAERAAYKAAHDAAEAIEKAAEIAREAAEKAAYANMTFAERVLYNDDLAQEELELEYEWSNLTPEELAIAIAAHQARELADEREDYLEWMTKDYEDRDFDLDDDCGLDDDVEDVEEIEIEDEEEFE